MIKEYFTDGLIGLAILLSLLRTDLLSANLNNLINYPEVQDIILGQTAAYLPTNFHTIQQLRHSPSRKDLELDNDALNSWYQNFNNLLRFRQGRQNEIEAFLVSESHTPIAESFTDNHSSSEISGNENITQSTTQLDLLLDQNSLNAEASVGHQRNASTSSESVSHNNGGGTDLTSVVSPFPECNLTREDLELIEALWKQDVDLGVGREVYDLSLRQELERERELEVLKQKEKKKAQLAAQEKEEKARQEKAGRWLKQNFRRDGETGEWVKVHNSSAERNNDTPVATTEDHNIDSLTLEDALEYFSSVTEPDFLNLENPDGQAVSSFQNLTSSYELNSLAEFQNVQEQTEPQPHLFRTQDSFEESLNGLVDYLNMANNTAPDSDIFAVGGMMAGVSEYKPDIGTSLELNMPPQVDHNSVLFQNASMPTPGIDVSNEFNISPAPCELNVSSVQQANTLNNSIDLGLDNLDFFQDLPNLPDGAVDELDLDAADFLLDMDNTPNMMEDALGMPAYGSLSMMGSDNLNSSSIALSSSPNQDLNEDFAGLEGATGGSNLTTEDFDGSYNKFSHLSESSSDSGIAFHGGFSSSSSSSSSSSYAGSPASSHHGNGSIASNDTDHDPHKTGSLAHHVAHNHTYNTLPGHTPREVKKYAHKEPSRKGPQSRDQKRASEMKVPFSVEEIIESPVDTFNEMLTKHKLTESQLTLIRDIRRRGKNKVAAQNCRKRKVHVIVSLADDLGDLEKARDKLRAEREEMEKETRKMKDKFSYLYTHIFQSLRDERGEPYDPNLYSLQQSSDGNVFLVPRNTTSNQTKSETGDRASRKRKAPDS